MDSAIVVVEVLEVVVVVQLERKAFFLPVPNHSQESRAPPPLRYGALGFVDTRAIRFVLKVTANFAANLLSGWQ